MGLKAKIWVSALMRRAEANGAHAYLLRRGAEEAGAVFVKLNRLDGTVQVFSPARAGEGKRVWTRPLGEAADEQTAAAYLARQIKFDPDIWIVEIEDREGRTFLDDPVM